MELWILTILVAFCTVAQNTAHSINPDILDLMMKVSNGFTKEETYYSKDIPIQDHITGDPIISVKEAFPLRNVVLEIGETYFFTAKARLLEDPIDVPFIYVNSYASMKLATGGRKLREISSQMMVSTSTGWFELGGDFTTVEGTAKVDFIVTTIGHRLQLEVSPSSLKLQHLSIDSAWKEEANARIEKIRKGDLEIEFLENSNYDTSKLEFHLEQTRAAFPWGTAINGGRLHSTGEENVKYREILSKYFTWGTPGNELKWRMMEGTEGSPRFTNADRALEGLENLGMEARGHCLAWSREPRILPWLLNKDPAGIKEALARRWSYIADRYGDRFGHWDVNNEQLHGQWFSEKLNDTDILTWMFKEFHKLVPNTKLFVNDFNTLAGNTHTFACKKQVERLIENDAPIGGIGIQAHFSNPAPLISYMKRFSLMGNTGVPIWLTEVDVRFGTDDEQVAFLDDILRLSFSLPYVEGIVFWGFWDKSMEPNVPPFMTGDNFELTKMGEKFDELLLKEWRTHESFTLSSTSSVNMRAFYGQYKLTATYENSTLWTKHIELENNTSGPITIEI